METIYEFIKLLVTVMVSVLITVLLTKGGYMGAGNQGFLTIDMQKVVKAHYVLIGRAANQDLDATLNLNGSSKNITAAIAAIAGDRLVLIAPVVASKLNNDITVEVIEYLGLKVPANGGPALLVNDVLPEMKESATFDPSDFYEKFELYQKEKARKAADKLEADKLESIIP